jgi:hypothetical protein
LTRRSDHTTSLPHLRSAGGREGGLNRGVLVGGSTGVSPPKRLEGTVGVVADACPVLSQTLAARAFVPTNPLVHFLVSPSFVGSRAAFSPLVVFTARCPLVFFACWPLPFVASCSLFRLYPDQSVLGLLPQALRLWEKVRACCAQIRKRRCGIPCAPDWTSLVIVTDEEAILLEWNSTLRALKLNCERNMRLITFDQPCKLGDCFVLIGAAGERRAPSRLTVIERITECL